MKEELKVKEESQKETVDEQKKSQLADKYADADFESGRVEEIDWGEPVGGEFW